VDDQQQVPDAALLRHLLTLRFMLGDATRWATQAGPERLTTAVILLDGVVERAVNLAASELPGPVGSREDMLKVAGKVREARRDWKPPAWRDILDLHRARNSAQHAGQRPNADDIAPWTNAVGAFVRDVVSFHLGIDLDRVALTDAVRHRSLRRLLEGAAASLAAEEHARSVQQSVNATILALSGWTGAQSMKVGIQELFADPPGPSGRLDALERRVALSTFAQDPAEVAWFSVVMLDTPANMDKDDAERALAFATSWILGYEATMRSWVSDREGRAQQQARRVRRDEASPAYIADGRVALTGDALVATLTLGDVPAADRYDAWKIYVERIRDEAEDVPRSDRVRDDGTVQLVARDLDELRERMVVLDSALKEADARQLADLAEDARRAGEDAERAAAYKDELEALGGMPEWIAAAEPSLGEIGTTVTLTIAPGYDWLVAGSDGLRSRLESDARVIRVSRRAGRQVDVTPRLRPADLLALLVEVDVDVQTQVRTEAERIEAIRRLGTEETQALLGIIRELDDRAEN
jgi:hypothetical protein